MRFSHLRIVTQVSIGVVATSLILLVIVGVSYQRLTEASVVANRISTLRTPTVNASADFDKHISVALASLRGWMLLKEPNFITERAEAWHSIRYSQKQLEALSGNWTHSDNVLRFSEISVLIDKLEASQNKVEFLAWHDNNLPATQLLISQATPTADLIFSQITKLMAAEQYSPISPERKKLFSAMADFRGSFAFGLAQIEAFLISADPIFIKEYETHWRLNVRSYGDIQGLSTLFNENQREIFSALVEGREKFMPLPNKIFMLRNQADWNRANYELENTTIPLAKQLNELLLKMTLDQHELLVIDTNFIRSSLSDYLKILLALTALAICTAAGASVYMKRKVGDPLNHSIDDAIRLARRVSSGEYLSEFKTETEANTETTIESESASTVAFSSYETTGLINSLSEMTTSLRGQAQQILNAIESAEAAAQEAEEAQKLAETVQEELAAQKDAMDQHSLVSVTDIKGNITYANEKFCTVSGYSQDELIGQNHSLLNSGHQVEAYWREMYLAVSKGNYWHDEVRNKAKDGHYYWVDTTIVPNYDAEGKLSGYTSIRTDITIQQENLQNLASIQEALTAQKDAMDQHSLVSVTDIKGYITYANDKFCAVSGYSQNELVGENHSLLNSDHQVESYWREMYLTASKGNCWHDEVRNKAKDGHHYWVDTTIVPNYDVEGKLFGYTSIRTDITIQKENNERLVIAKKEADVANVSKADFLANMSHEIRTPMNGVIGMTNLLLSTTLDTDQYKLAKTVKSSGEILLSIINDILDFSKAEAGKLELEYLDFNLGQMVEDMGSTIAYQSEAKGLELICPANPVINKRINGDPGRIRQILINLIGNAIKFTEHGEIAVYVQIEDKGNRLKQCHFEIKDTGIGVSQEQQDNLFGKFTQADSSTTRKYGGTGLGLSICKQLVELMGGEIGIDSVIGEGSTFWFNFECEEVEAVNNASVFDQNIKHQKVLIVDDNETNRELMHKLHDHWGIKNTLVSSGKEALRALEKAAKEKTPYDIAILDMHMPEMDGLELCKRIKTHSEIGQTKLIMATSQAKRGDAKMMKGMGFNGYLTKPIHQSDLFDILHQVSGVSEDNGILITRFSQRENIKFTGHVLVVEDNTINQMVIEGLLENFGVTIHLANNGEEALAALRDSAHIELVFMDCQMPVMDGYEATKIIRDPSTRLHNHAIPVIAMTANAMAGDREKCLKAGMDDYVSKPIDPDDVKRVLVNWLPKNRQRLNNPATDAEQRPTTTLEDNVPIFDFQAFSNRLRGNEKRMQIIFEKFSEDCTHQIVELIGSLETNDADQVKRTAHTMRGSSANVGAMALSALALEFELAANNGELATLHQRIRDVENGFSVLKKTAKERLY